VEFVFFPFDTSPIKKGWRQGDQFLAGALQRRLKNKSSFIVMKKEDYTPTEIKGIIGTMDLFISMRVIPLVLACSMKVPCIAISCLQKISSFADMAGFDTFNLEDFDAEILIHSINKLRKLGAHEQKKNNQEQTKREEETIKARLNTFATETNTR